MFSVYTADFHYGQCKMWIDKDNSQPYADDDEEAVKNNPSASRKYPQCQSCSTRSNCSTCLQGLGCGWCYNIENPTIGSCTSGTFDKAYSGLCVQDENQDTLNWAYSDCPDIDECSLDLHDCHANAICINFHGSFDCKCNKVYQFQCHSLPVYKMAVSGIHW